MLAGLTPLNPGWPFPYHCLAKSQIQLEVFTLNDNFYIFLNKFKKKKIF